VENMYSQLRSAERIALLLSLGKKEEWANGKRVLPFRDDTF